MSLEVGVAPVRSVERGHQDLRELVRNAEAPAGSGLTGRQLP